MKISIALRALFAVAVLALAFAAPGEYSAFLVMLYVWFLFADQEGHYILGLVALVFGMTIYFILSASLLGFVLGIIPIIIISWLAPSVSRRGTGGWVTNKGGMGAFYNSDIEAQTDRRRNLNRTIRWNIWGR